MIRRHAYVLAVPDLAHSGAFYRDALGAGAEVTKPLRNEPWGMREFGLRTVDGHRIMIGAPIAAE